MHQLRDSPLLLTFREYPTKFGFTNHKLNLILHVIHLKQKQIYNSKNSIYPNFLEYYRCRSNVNETDSAERKIVRCLSYVESYTILHHVLCVTCIFPLGTDYTDITGIIDITEIPPTDGNWGYWGSWTACSTTCGGGSRIRTRQCTNPPPSNGGNRCEGSSHQQQSCTTGGCA